MGDDDVDPTGDPAGDPTGDVVEVADGEHAVTPGRPGLLGVTVILEGGVAHLEIDRAGLAGGALVYGYGKSTAGALDWVLARQFDPDPDPDTDTDPDTDPDPDPDPDTVAPLWPDAISVAAFTGTARDRRRAVQ